MYKDVLEMVDSITSLSDFGKLGSKYFDVLYGVHGDEFEQTKKEVQIFLLSNFHYGYQDYHGLLENMSNDDCEYLKIYSYFRFNETKSEYAKVMYMFALLNLCFKLKQFGKEFNGLFKDCFDLFEILLNKVEILEIDFLHNLFLCMIDFSVKTGLKKDYFDKIYNLIMLLNMDICVCSLLLNYKMLNSFSDRQQLDILSHLFNQVESEIVNFSDNILKETILSPFIEGFFNKSLDFLLKKCDAGKKNVFQSLQYKIADFTIKYIDRYLSIEEFEIFKKMMVLQKELQYAKYHKDKKIVQNNILLTIINLAPSLNDSVNKNVDKISIPLPQEYIENRKEQEKKLENNSVDNFLIAYAFGLFQLGKLVGLDDNEFNISLIASVMMLDDVGLPIGYIKENEANKIEKLRNMISLYISQFIYDFYDAVKNKLDFKDYLLSIKIFNSNEDKHIHKSMMSLIEDDYYGFVVRCVPLIEKRLRLILRFLGEADITENDIGGFDYRPIKSFISSDVVSEFFGKDIQFVFKIIFDDRRGFNLRNKIAHGIVEADEIQLFHTLLVLFTLIFLSNLKFEQVSS